MISHLVMSVLVAAEDYMLDNVHNDCLSSLLSELNRCHLDLSELNRLIQSLQTLEIGQAFTNGDLKRIISIQVDLFNQLQVLPPSQAVKMSLLIVIFCFFPNLNTESFTWEAKEVEVREDVGPLAHTFQSGGPGNGKNGPWLSFHQKIRLFGSLIL